MPTLETLPHNIQFKSLKRFAISIGNDEHEDLGIDDYPQCCALNLTDMKIPLRGWIKKLMKEVEILRLDSFENVSNINDVKDVNFNKLRLLHLSKCDNVPCLVDMVNFDSAQAFCNLEELCLARLQKLTQIIRGEIRSTDRVFMELRVIYISNCPNILTALELNLLSCLQNLTRLSVYSCGSMEHIFEPMEIDYGASCFQNLHTLDLIGCNNMRYVFSPSIAKRLSRLERLYVRGCIKIEEIIGVEEIEEASTATEKIVMFPSLSYIALLRLRGLKSFSLEHFNLTEYPSLAVLEIYACENMETWGCGIQLTPNLKEMGIDDNESGMVKLKNGDYGMELFISNHKSMGEISHDP